MEYGEGEEEPCSACAFVQFDFRCPEGYVVTGFGGVTGDWLNALGPITCSDAVGTQSVTWGNPASKSGTHWNHASPRGYHGVTVRYDDTSINLLYLAPAETEPVQYGDYIDVDRESTLLCPPGAYTHARRAAWFAGQHAMRLH
jgi:hypothetical protein